MVKHAAGIRQILLVLAMVPAAQVAQAQLYVSTSTGVSEYDALTGASINPALITGLPATPSAMTLAGGNLYLSEASATSSSIEEFNASTGAAVNTLSLSGIQASGVAVYGSNLYVAGSVAGAEVLNQYDANTGALILSSLLPPSTAGNGARVVVSSTGTGYALYDATQSVGVGTVPLGGFGVELFNAGTGAVTNASFIPAYTGLNYSSGFAVGGNRLYISSAAADSIAVYDATTGAPINNPNILGLIAPQNMAVAGGRLFINSFVAGAGVYDATTYAPINLLLPLGQPFAVGAVPEPGPAALMIGGLLAIGFGARVRRSR